MVVVIEMIWCYKRCQESLASVGGGGLSTLCMITCMG